MPFNIKILDLADFEDLYYAACAKLKELLHGVDIYLNNGFKAPCDTYFVYSCPRFDILDPITVGDFKASLLVYASILYSNEFTELLNKGIVMKSMRDIKYSRQKQVSCAHNAMHNSIEHIYNSDYDIRAHTEEHFQLQHGMSQKNLQWPTGIDGLQNTRNMSCSMIYATLAEKYRPTIINTGSMGAPIHREATPGVPQACQEACSNQAYISPYNLEERAKKLNVTGGPEMPCICDPDCMCALVCASDPTQNCLCEENGLFARVTQGMDIDDLDVPDLVRRSRPGSEASGSSVISLLESVQTLSEPSIDATQYTPITDTFDDGYASIDDQKEQQESHQHRSLIDIEVVNTMPMHRAIASPDIDQYEVWESPCMIPPRVSSLSYRDYREALRQPFAKLCDHPPKRTSMAQRLFGAHSHNVAASNKALCETTAKVFKQGNKRSLPSMSITGLKSALRRH